MTHQQLIKREWQSSTTTRRAPSGHHWSWNFYDASNRLRYAQRTNYTGDGKETVFEDYWYDALGRRVAVRSRADSVSCVPGYRTGHCLQTYLRVVWDGDQILAETRGDGDWSLADALVGSQPPYNPYDPYQLAAQHYGSAWYLQTGAIDAPAVAWGNGGARVLHRNWRGNVAGATFVATGLRDNETTWPAAYTDAWYRPDANQTLPAANRWLGSLVVDQRDATGTLYRRNRYYDPTSGRFTQEDPIGLAGGLNLYGYANGDPINNSDPFGLSAESRDETRTASDTTSAGRSQSLNIASCAGAALTFSSLAVLDVLTVASGVKVAAAGVSFAGRTLSAGLASSLSLSTANRYAAAAMGAGDALVNTAIPAAASGFVRDAPLTAAISGTEPGGTIGLSSFIPFSGTAGRVGRVASECAALSNTVPGFR